MHRHAAYSTWYSDRHVPRNSVPVPWLRTSKVLPQRLADHLGDRGAIGLRSSSSGVPKGWLKAHGLHSLGSFPQRWPAGAPRTTSQLACFVAEFSFVCQMLDHHVRDRLPAVGVTVDALSHQS